MATREQYQERAEFYTKNYYGQLEGATIVKFLGIKDEYPTFLTKYKDGAHHNIQVSSDEEGNDGGVLFLPFEPLMDSYDRQHKLNAYEEKE